MPSNRKTPHQILVAASGRLFGPFPDQDTAHTWVETSRTPNAEMYSLWEPAAQGTAETAHECGTRLAGIDETSSTGRKAAGA